MKNAITLFTFLFIFFSVTSYSQQVEIIGTLNGHYINYTSTNAGGSKYIDKFEIYFPIIKGANVDEIQIFNLDQTEIADKTFSITKNANNKNEVSIEFNINDVCGDLKCENGELVVEQLTKDLIKANGFTVFQNKILSSSDTVRFSFSTSLYDAIPKLPSEKTDANYQYENVVLTGNLSKDFILGKKLKNTKVKGNIEFGIAYIEIEMEQMDDKYKDFELELWSPFVEKIKSSSIHRFDKKLKPGKYEILPFPEIEDSVHFVSLIEQTKPNQIYGDIDDDKNYEDIPIKGELIIDHLSDKRMKGSFNLKVLYKNNDEYIRGEFDVPVELK